MATGRTNALNFSFNFIILLLGVEIIDLLFPVQLDALGIRPRTPGGLIGIVFSPLLHGNFTHLFANLIPLWVLCLILFSDSRYRPMETLSTVWIVSGLGTWLIGRNGSVHIGASSVIFGLASYLIVSGFLMKSWRAFFVAILVLLAFGSMFYGILPQHGPISWEGHLSGFIAGIWAARSQHSSSTIRRVRKTA